MLINIITIISQLLKSLTPFDYFKYPLTLPGLIEAGSVPG